MYSLRRTVLLVLAILWGLVPWPSCRSKPDPPPSGQPRLVFVYATCTARANYLSPFGNESFTPNLERIGDQSVVFTKHRTEAGQSGVAYASIVSGAQAPIHGVFQHPNHLSSKLELLTETFSNNGYEVHVWTQHEHASPDLGYVQGAPRTNIHRKERLVATDPDWKRLLRRLRRDSNYKAMVFANSSVSHGPYGRGNIKRFCSENPGECDESLLANALAPGGVHSIYLEHRLALQFNFGETIQRLGLSAETREDMIRTINLAYRSRLHFLDQLFGGLVDSLRTEKLLSTSIVVFTADHGEYLSEHASPLKWEHGYIVPATTLDVPWMILAQNRLEPRRVLSVTRSIDVFPTVAGLAKLATPSIQQPTGFSESLVGVDFSQHLLTNEPLPVLLAFSHGALPPNEYFNKNRFTSHTMRNLWRLFPAPHPRYLWTALRRKDTVFKLRFKNDSWTVEAFNLPQDPYEVNDIYDPKNKDHFRAAELLRNYKRFLVQTYKYHQDQRRTDAALSISESEAAQRLRSMGYIR